MQLQQEFVDITSDAAALGVPLNGLQVSTITIAGQGSNQTEVNFTGDTTALVNWLNNSSAFTSQAQDPMVGPPHPGYTGNYRQNTTTWSMQINTNAAGAQIDIDSSILRTGCLVASPRAAPACGFPNSLLGMTEPVQRPQCSNQTWCEHGEPMHRRQLISRRVFLGGGILAAPLLGGVGASTAAPDTPADAEITVRLSKEIKNARLLDLSPDGTKLCLYFSRSPVRSFRLSGEAWKENNAPIRDREEALKIINLDSWAQVFATRFPRCHTMAVFFADGMEVYVGIPGVNEAGGSGNMHLLIDLRDSRTLERFARYSPDELMFFYSALGNGILLGDGRDPKPNRSEVAAESPAFKEISRAPFAVGPRLGPRETETPISVSRDRKTFAYGVDDKVVYRDASDLSVIWTATMKPSLQLWHVALSGRYVAASSDGYADWPPKQVQEGYVGILDKATGREATRIYADASEGVAISPDERFLSRRLPRRHARAKVRHSANRASFRYRIREERRDAYPRSIPGGRRRVPSCRRQRKIHARRQISDYLRPKHQNLGSGLNCRAPP